VNICVESIKRYGFRHGDTLVEYSSDNGHYHVYRGEKEIHRTEDIGEALGATGDEPIYPCGCPAEICEHPVDDAAKLSAFLKALEDAGVRPINLQKFRDRLRLQKYVFFAKRFRVPGFEKKYAFSEYMYGPYSPRLSEVYDIKVAVCYDPEYLEELQKAGMFKRFVEFIRDRDDTWLEVAAVIVMTKDAIHHCIRKEFVDESRADDVILSIVCPRYPEVPREKVEEILNEVRKI